MAHNRDRDVVQSEIVEDDNQRSGQTDPTKTQLILASSSLPDRIYLVPINNKPIFPGLMFPMRFEPGPIADALRSAYEDVPERCAGFVLTKSETAGPPDKLDESDLHRVGTAVRILKLQQGEQGGIQVLLRGEERFQLLKTARRDHKLVAQVVYLQDIVHESQEVQATAMGIIGTLRELVQTNPLFSEEIKMFLSQADWREPGHLADFAANLTSATREELQEVLEALDVKERLEKVLFLLRKELDISRLKEKITHQIEEKITKQQREFFLREQLKAIKAELGLEKDEKTEEIERYEKRIAKLTLPPEAETRIREEIDKLKLLSPQSPEFSVTRNYLDWLTGLPWGEFSRDRLDVKRSRRVLNRDHYGLEDVKNRILEFIGVAKLRGGVEGSILCLIGPPGVGKTSLGKAVAESLGREFFRFSLGGMRDEAEIKGHRRTYIGALPGKVMQAIKTVGTGNPVIMLDEIDKVGASFQGDPASALLEVLDPEQNVSFRDHYLDVPFDLSKVLFIATANVPDTIPGPLMDRMEVIRLSGYIMDEKISIAKRHLVPRLLTKHALTRDDVRFTDGALKELISGYAREAGVRALEKALSSCLRKVAAGKAEGNIDEQVVIGKTDVESYMGKPVYSDEPLMKEGRPGVVMGLAWTPLGGTTLYVEAVPVPGDGDIKLTGQLGNVMQESSHIAYSLITSDYGQFGIEQDFFKNRRVHLHVPAGATPKDGPSAGITMATALVSVALGKTPPPDVAMTGELTLTGRVLPVGGIKEKVIAAKRSGVKDVILPKQNEKDFVEIPDRVREGIRPHYVEDYQEVYKLVFDDGLA